MKNEKNIKYGKKEEIKIINKLNKENLEIKFIRPIKDIEENQFDFKIKIKNKEIYFEIYTPEYDIKIFEKKYREYNFATLFIDYLIYGILLKYKKQFERNPPKYLILNLNKINKSFTDRIYFKNDYLKTELEFIFNFNKIKYSNKFLGDMEIKKLDFNKLRKMKGIILYSKNKPIKIYLNPNLNFKTYEINFIKKIFKIEPEKLKVKNIDENNIPTKIINKKLSNLIQKKFII